MIINNNHA